MNESKDWISKLDLLAHPEGGHYKEVYRSEETIISQALPSRFSGDRSCATSIYYLLKRGEFSKFHRIKSDEIWHFYAGSPMQIIHIDIEGKLVKRQLGIDIENETIPQLLVCAGDWFAAQSLGDYSLVGCTVSPGFDFADFEIADRKKLISAFPQHQKTIEKFT